MGGPARWTQRNGLNQSRGCRKRLLSRSFSMPSRGRVVEHEDVVVFEKDLARPFEIDVMRSPWSGRLR
jgi:hypothetical protein